VSPKHSAETVNEDKINVFSFQYVVIIWFVDVTEARRKLYNKGVHSSHSSCILLQADRIKKDKIGGACSAY
jgi:hypothetical protein